MQDTRCVTRELRHFRHRGVFPQAKLVLAEAVRTKDLSVMTVPLQSTDLQHNHVRKML